MINKKVNGKVFKLLGVIIILLLLGEGIMRYYGFCNSPLYKDDTYSNYNLVENQNVERFGNTYITNEYSMRSLPLNENEYRILMCGDSVVNGGTQTDHSMLASTKLENSLRKDFSTSNVRVLNSSCGGWGIDNYAGVIKKNGSFNSKLIVLVVNSHDAVGKMGTSNIAGISKNFPDKQYFSAWIELFDRYLIPGLKSKISIVKDDYLNSTVEQTTSEGWKYFLEYSKQHDIPLIIYLHATKTELNNGCYDNNGEWIINFAKENNIKLIKDINSIELKDYRDDIHLSEKGQDIIYNQLYEELKESIKVNK